MDYWGARGGGSSYAYDKVHTPGTKVRCVILTALFFCLIFSGVFERCKQPECVTSRNVKVCNKQFDRFVYRVLIQVWLIDKPLSNLNFFTPFMPIYRYFRQIMISCCNSDLYSITSNKTMLFTRDGCNGVSICNNGFDWLNSNKHIAIFHSEAYRWAQKSVFLVGLKLILVGLKIILVGLKFNHINQISEKSFTRKKHEIHYYENLAMCT